MCRIGATGRRSSRDDTVKIEAAHTAINIPATTVFCFQWAGLFHQPPAGLQTYTINNKIKIKENRINEEYEFVQRKLNLTASWAAGRLLASAVGSNQLMGRYSSFVAAVNASPTQPRTFRVYFRGSHCRKLFPSFAVVQVLRKEKRLTLTHTQMQRTNKQRHRAYLGNVKPFSASAHFFRRCDANLY